MKQTNWTKLWLVMAAVTPALVGCGGGSDAALLASGDDSADSATRATSTTTQTDQAANELDSASSTDTSSNSPAETLALTDEQIAQGQSILGQTRDDGDALRDASIAVFRAIFTDAQRATLDLVRPPLALAGDEPPPSGFRGGPGGPHGPGFGPPHGPGHGFDAFLYDDLVDSLSLTEEQQASIAAVQDEFETNTQALRDQTQTDLRAILTEEQIAALDSIPTVADGLPHGCGRIGHHGPRGGFGPFGGLDLTEDQRTQIDAVHTQARTDSEVLLATAREEVRAALAEDQLTIIDGLSDSSAQHRGRFYGPRGIDLPSGLSDSLSLSAEQAANIDGIAQALRTSLADIRDQEVASIQALLTAVQLAQRAEHEVVHALVGPGAHGMGQPR